MQEKSLVLIVVSELIKLTNSALPILFSKFAKLFFKKPLTNSITLTPIPSLSKRLRATQRPTIEFISWAGIEYKFTSIILMLFYIIFNSGLSTNKKIAHKRSSIRPDSNNSFSDVVKSPIVKIALYISIKSISLPFFQDIY